MNLRTCQQGSNGAGDRAEQVCLPGNAGLTGQHAPDDRAIEHPYQHRCAKRHSRSVDKAARDQKAELPENESGCADVNGRTAKKPDKCASQADHDSVHGHQGARCGRCQQGSQQEQGGRIRKKVFETAMQHGHADHTVKPTDLPGNEPECRIESVARRPIENLDDPQRDHETGQRRHPPQEYPHVAPAPFGRRMSSGTTSHGEAEAFEDDPAVTYLHPDGCETRGACRTS